MSAVVGAGCKKDQQSLVLVELKLSAGAPDATGLKSVTLMATPGPTATFPLSMLSANTGITLGLYFSGDVTGNVQIVATAVPQSGCAGFHGNGSVTIGAPGATESITITMVAADACLPDGGAAGSGGGRGGTGGSSTAGTGGSNTAGTGGGNTAGAGGSNAAGTGGSNAAGTGGSNTAGKGGSSAAGTGGRNTAGTGGSGFGGSGGGAGMGGMAGYPSIAGCRTFAHCTTSCPNTSVSAVAISPSGQLVASAGDDGRVKIWSFDGRTLTATGTVLTGFAGYGVAFSPDGTRMVYTSSTTLRTYTVAGWVAGTTLLNDGSSNDFVSAAFTPNGQRIVSADAIGSAGGDVFAHEVGGSALPALTKHVARQPASLAVSKVAASDGSVGVVVGTYNATVAVLTLGASGFTDPTVLSPSAGSAAVYAVRFSGDGSLVAMGDDNGIVRFWAFPLASTTPPPVGNDLTFAGGDIVNDIAFSPNGMYVAVGGGFAVKQLSIYNLATRAEVDRTTPAGGDINSLVFSPSGAAIIAGLDAGGYVIVCN